MVSLIVPCYNSESYIERCIESILNQTYKEVELIIINDGLNDATEEKLDKFKRKIEEKFVRYIYINIRKMAGLVQLVIQHLKA